MIDTSDSAGRSVLELAVAMEQVVGVHRDAAAAVLRDAGVSESVVGLLWALLDSDDVEPGGEPDMGELAQRLSCDRSNVTLLAATLERHDLAERVTGRGDARRRILRLTAPGKALARSMEDAVVASSPLSRLAPDQHREVARILEECVGADLHG